MGNVTLLLRRLQSGDPDAERELVPLVYVELRRLALRLMGGEQGLQTLQPTALVHEAYMRLFKSAEIDWQGRAHFFAVASQVMRRILIDKARSRRAAKRGGAWQRLSVEDTILKGQQRSLDFIVLDEALDRLEAAAPRPSRVVEMIFFGGMTMGDAAIVLGVSEKTVKRDWAAAKAWLHKEIYGSDSAVG